MAVAVKNLPDTTTQSERSSLATASMLGSVYVIAALIVLAAGVPWLWSNSGISAWLRDHVGPFVDVACLIVVELFALGVLTMLGLSLSGSTPKPGLKAGVFTIVAGLVGIAALVSMFAGTNPIWDSVAAVIGVVALFFGWRFVAGPTFPSRMQQFEDQGWFNFAAYKPNQGRLVRRGTMLGLLVLSGCGLWTLLNHGSLNGAGNAAGGKDWALRVPFTTSTDAAGKIVAGPMMIKVLPDVRLTVPLILALASFWLSYRIVHMPTFAEFLIATEGELNKVAWPTRKSLIQDTIVVLATVVLLTFFLFFVDIAWGWILGNKYIGVLRLESSQPTQVQEVKEPEW